MSTQPSAIENTFSQKKMNKIPSVVMAVPRINKTTNTAIEQCLKNLARKDSPSKTTPIAIIRYGKNPTRMFANLSMINITPNATKTAPKMESTFSMLFFCKIELIMYITPQREIAIPINQLSSSPSETEQQSKMPITRAIQDTTIVRV